MKAVFKNSNFPFIDADSHLEEPEDVFKYLDDKYSNRKPLVVDIGDAVTWCPDRNKVWLIDGEIRPKLFGPGGSCYGTPVTSNFAKKKPVSIEVQSLADPDAYCEGMDSIGLDVAVIYPTLFLHPLSEDAYYEAALMKAYNSYMAEACSKREDRLRWAAVIPMAAPDEAVKEIERVHKLGASTVMMLGTVGNKMLHDQAHDPIFEKIQSLNMPISVHVGWSHTGIQETSDSIAAGLFLNFEMSPLFAFFSFVSGGIFDKYPDLRVAFIESGVNWFPVALERMSKWYKTQTAQPWPAKKSPADYVRDHQIYFTVEGDEENLVEFINFVGADRILGAADFPHVHYEGASLSTAFTDLKNCEGISKEQLDKILGHNSQQFYNIY